MKLKGINASSKKTVDLIKKTFAELVEEKREMQSITVTELVKRANLTRGAFYSHYDNIYQVANEFQEEILEQVFGNDIKIHNHEDLQAYIDNFFMYLDEHNNIYSQLLTSDEALLFITRLNKKICLKLPSIINDQTSHLNSLFFTDGTINLIVKYFRGEIEESLEDIHQYIKRMAKQMFSDINIK